jgi:hypothetical protein
MDQDIGEAPVEIGRLLDELRLRAFVFTGEPKEGRWMLRVECATDGEWQTITLPLEGPRRLSTLRDPSKRVRLKAVLHERLRTCAKASD